MSTTFVVPYPPGFPVLVPGQVVSKEIIYFLAQLDVKEIHGYNHDLGLSVFTQEALARMEAQRNAATAAVGAAVPVFEIHRIAVPERLAEWRQWSTARYGAACQRAREVH